MPDAFPAYAGMIRLKLTNGAASIRIPRIRGDDPSYLYGIAGLQKHSPHTRG